MPTIDDVKSIIKKLPATLHIKGMAISRCVYNSKDVSIDTSFTRDYNWGCVCSGTNRLAEDLWKTMKCTADMALFLAPTLSEYILAKLPDNFEIKLQVRKFMTAVLADETMGLYDKYVEVLQEHTPQYVEISKNSLRVDEEDKKSTKVVAGADDTPLFVETEFGRHRAGISERLTKELNKLRGTDEDKTA